MFGLLKKKLSRVVESISDKLKKKEEAVEKVEEALEEEKPPEEILEQITPVKGEIPEIVDEIKLGLTEIKERPEETKSIFKRIKEKIRRAVIEKKLTEKDLLPILDELEVGLIEADVAVEVVIKIKQDLLQSLVGKEIRKGKDKEVVIEALKNSLLEILDVPKIDLDEVIKKAKGEGRPAVLLFLGFNGSGKTTSIAKVSKWLVSKNYTCMFAAADTWRAAAIEQIEEHGKKLEIPVIKHKYGSDPAAIVYDGISSSKAKGIDALLADSAGRTHVNKNLIDELKKVIRVNKPDLKILILDSLTGNDSLVQMQMFDENVGVDAVILTKMDVNEKGGAALSVAFQKKPILFIGIGQEYGDLKEFDKEQFVDNLFAEKS